MSCGGVAVRAAQPQSWHGEEPVRLDYESQEDAGRASAERRRRLASVVYGTLAACAALAYVAVFIYLWIDRVRSR